MPLVPIFLRSRVDIAAAFCAVMVAMLTPIALPTANAAETTPTQMLSGIYGEAVKGNTSEWLEPKRRRNYLSRSLLALWAEGDARKPAEGDAGPIDFDLTTDTNGLELRSFAIKVVSESSTAAVIAVKLNYRKPYYRPGPPAVVTYEFVREDRSWRIDNIRTGEWSIRDMLAQWLKAP